MWRAVQIETGRQVVVKELSPALVADDSFMARYRDLAIELVALGDDVNRVQVIECIEEPGRVWVVEPWVDGRRLDRIAATNGSLTPEQSVALVSGVLSGLAAAKGIVHGDVRPENIVVSVDGTPRVTDFGLPVPPGDSENGAGQYRSPEAVRGERLDARSDVYSAGAVLRELLGSTLTDGLAKPEAAKSEPGPGAKKLARLVQRSVAEDPRKRPARAGTFRTSLDRLAEECFGDGWQARAATGLAASAADRAGDHSGAAATPGAQTWKQRRGRRPIPRSTVLCLSAALLLLLGAAAITVDRRSGDTATKVAAPPAPQATPDEIAGSDIAGTWVVVVSVAESTGFFDSSAGTATVKPYVIGADCSKTPCAHRLTIVGSPEVFDLPRVADGYAMKAQGPNDCADLRTGEVRVPSGGVASVELTLHPTAARHESTGWVATAFVGGVVTTYEGQNPACKGGSGMQRAVLTATRR